MTSSPEPLAAWSLPELGAARRAAAPPASAHGGAWSLPKLEPGDRSPDPRVRVRTEAEEAYERGFAEGLREGTSRAEDRIRPALEAVARVAESFEAAGREVARDRERDLHGLALAVARKLVRREMTADPALARDLVGRALDMVPPDAPLEVRLSPDDLGTIGPELERLHASGRPAAIQWIADPALERGDFLIESPLRIVDGRTDAALRSLYERLDRE
jgi:flagellar biosynthesis/type III secretory pathway protein FliH